jgi:hypothetical protein
MSKCQESSPRADHQLFISVPKKIEPLVSSLCLPRGDRTRRRVWPDIAPASGRNSPSTPMPATCPCANSSRLIPTVTSQSTSWSRWWPDVPLHSTWRWTIWSPGRFQRALRACFSWRDVSGRGRPDTPGVRLVHRALPVFLSWRHHDNWRWTVNRHRPISSVRAPLKDDRTCRSETRQCLVWSPCPRPCARRWKQLTGCWRQRLVTLCSASGRRTTPPFLFLRLKWLRPCFQLANHKV